MAIAMVQEFPVDPGDTSTANYDSIKEGLNVEADPPEGLIVHTAGFTGTGMFRIFDVWESEEAWLKFNEQRLMPLVQPMIDSGEGPPTTEYTYELHDLVKG